MTWKFQTLPLHLLITVIVIIINININIVITNVSVNKFIRHIQYLFQQSFGGHGVIFKFTSLFL